MEENILPDFEQNDKPRKAWYKRAWFLFILFSIFIAAAIYFGYNKIKNHLPEHIFNTAYEPIASPDSIDYTNDTLLMEEFPIMDTTTLLEDTFFVEEIVPFKEPADTSAEASIENLFKVNTDYEKIESRTDSLVTTETSEQIEEKGVADGLFEALLLEDGDIQKDKTSFSSYARRNIISSKSVLKLLAIPGKHILLGEGTTDDQEMISVLTESDHVVSVLLADRKGVVVYATNRKDLNTSIALLMPRIDRGSNNLSWYQEEGKDVVALPLYHTYGRIGMAVLVTK